MTDSSPSGGASGSRDERLNSMFLVLADEDRRHIVQYFVGREDPATSVDELVEYVLARTEGETTADDLERRFHHQTLPTLAEHGVVEYDDRSRTVRYRGPPVLEDVLSVVEEADLRAE